MESVERGINLSDIWARFPKSQRVAMVSIFLILVVGIITLSLLTTREKFTPLFTGLSLGDAGEIVNFLKEKGIDYRLGENGSIIEVPDDRVYETRIDLATQGLPRGGISGFEILNEVQFGATDFERRTRYYLALQGELVRTIKAMEAVEDARVHIVVPEESVFLRDRSPATASVLLKLKWGAELTAPQIRAIANLVASGVEGLSWEDVTIIDVNGNDLSARILAQGEAISGTGALKTHLEIKEGYERQLEEKVRSMLEKVFGPGRVIIRVFADMDFDQIESAKVTFTPLQNPDGSQGGLRSEEVREEAYTTSSGSAPAGVPGTTSNIPTYPAIDDQDRNGDYHKIESVRNYELNKEEERYISSPGKILRITASAWIDGNLTTVERDLVEQTIAGAIGFDAARGDVINIASGNFDTSLAAVFATPQMPAAKREEWWKDPVVIGVLAGMLLIMGSLLIIFRRRRRSQLDVIVGEPEMAASEEMAATTSPIEEETEATRLRRELIKLVEEQPEEVAQLIRVWLSDK